MKSFYLTTCAILFSLILYFTFLLFTYKPVTVNKKVLKKTVSLLDQMYKIENSINKNKTSPKKIKQANPVIWEKNLFSTNRIGGLTSFGLTPEDMELVGIIDTKSVKGAIIFLVSSTNNLQRQASNPKHINKKTFFMIKDELPNGYMLAEIDKKSVTLIKNRKSFTLKLKHDDENSNSRISQILQNEAKRKAITSLRNKNNTPSKKPQKARKKS